MDQSGKPLRGIEAKLGAQEPPICREGPARFAEVAFAEMGSDQCRLRAVSEWVGGDRNQSRVN